MKAEEIRNEEICLGSDPIENIRDCAFFLKEIAAQFADLNERLDGFMGSMAVLAKGIAELNMELQKSNKKRFDRPGWFSGGYR